MRKLQSNNGGFLIGIPKSMVTALDLHKSDLVKLELNGDNKIVMEKLAI